MRAVLGAWKGYSTRLKFIEEWNSLEFSTAINVSKIYTPRSENKKIYTGHAMSVAKLQKMRVEI